MNFLNKENIFKIDKYEDVIFYNPLYTKSNQTIIEKIKGKKNLTLYELNYINKLNFDAMNLYRPFIPKWNLYFYIGINSFLLQEEFIKIDNEDNIMNIINSNITINKFNL